jgi:hypothetical protein
VAPSVAATHGYALAFQIGAVLLAIGGVLVLVVLEHVSATPRQAEVEIAGAPALADATAA